MGVEGPGLWQDDTAADVRSIYREALEDKASDAEAQERVLTEFRDFLDDADDGPVVWISLAVTQHEHGRLDDHVRDRALAAIPRDLQRWEHNPDFMKKRKAILSRVASKLTGVQPPRKRVTRPRAQPTPLKPGDVLRWQAPSGRFFLVLVRAVRADRGGSYPIIQLLEWEQRRLPTQQELKNLPFRKKGRSSAGSRPAEPWWSTSGLVGHQRPSDYLKAGFEVVAQLDPPSSEEQERLASTPSGSSGWGFWVGYLTKQDEQLVEPAAAGGRASRRLLARLRGPGSPT
jgi:hypothetical protein